MNSHHYEIITASADETRAIGRKMGQGIETGVLLCLNGDLGSGKTCFVQGLARGLGVSAAYDVTSPTYTLINEYPGRLPLYHVDLYRLEGPLDPADLGLEDILYDHIGVVAVEWADRLASQDRPGRYLDLEFSATSDDQRRICIKACGLGADNLIKRLFIN